MCGVVPQPHLARLLLPRRARRDAHGAGSGQRGARARWRPLPTCGPDAGSCSHHLHPDHCLDLTAMYVARTYHPTGPGRPPLPVHGPEATARADRGRLPNDRRRSGVDGLRAQSSDSHDHAPEPVRIGPFTITVTRVAHPVEATRSGWRPAGRQPGVQRRHRAQPGPGGPGPGGRPRPVRGVVPQHGPDNPPDLHLTGTQAGEHATAAGSGRLVLTHLVAWNDLQQTQAEARSAFDGEVALAAPGMVVEL